MIMKLERGTEVRYLEWSTTVDAPVTYGMTVAELHDYVQAEYGRRGLEELPARLDRVERFGTSSIRPCSANDLITANRAGEKESCLTLDQIWERYVDANE